MSTDLSEHTTRTAPPVARPRRHSDDYSHLEPLFTEAVAADTAPWRREQLEQELVLGYQPIAEHIARRFRNRGQPLEDLTQIAMIGLVNAVRRFDPDHGAQFLSFAVPTITGEIRRYFRDSSWAVRMPRQLQERHAAIENATTELGVRLGRAPRPSEIATELDISVEDVREGIEAGLAYRSVPLDRPADPDGSTTIADRLGAQEHGYADVERRDLLHPALRALPEREAAIVVMRFYENLTQSQIAARIGVSQMHVSRLLTASLQKLRETIALPTWSALD